MKTSKNDLIFFTTMLILYTFLHLYCNEKNNPHDPTLAHIINKLILVMVLTERPLVAEIAYINAFSFTYCVFNGHAFI